MYTANPGDEPRAVTTGDVEKNAPPPSYDSLFGKIKNAKAESDGNVDYGKRVMGIIFGSLFFTIFAGVMLAIPIAEIVIGAVYINDCPAERYIPIYLVVAGSFGIAKGLLNFVLTAVKKKKQRDMTEEERKEDEKAGTNPVDSLLNGFLFAWFIAGNVWVYRTVGDWVSSPETAWNYCHPTVYYFAFWIITVSYIMMGVCLLLCIFVCVCCCCCAGKGDD